MVENDKRKYLRYSCKINCKFDYYEGDPNNINMETLNPEKQKGTIIDISQGGAFIVNNSRVSVGMPVIVNFKILKNKITIEGKIVRTGMLENNPSEFAKKFAFLSSKGDSYIAVEFKELIEEMVLEEL